MANALEQKNNKSQVIWANTFSEGDFPHCTLFAISKAICDYGYRINLKLNFNEIQRSLLQHLTTFQPEGSSDGWHPSDFDGIHLPLISSEEDYGNLDISVVEGCSKTFFLEEKHILFYFSVRPSLPSQSRPIGDDGRRMS